MVKATTGQYIANKILETVAKIRKTRNSPSYSLKIHWTAGHAGIKGNEEVDGEAKKATEGTTLQKQNLPPLLHKPLKHNKAALQQSKKVTLKNRWRQEWDASTRAQRYKDLDLSFPSNNFVKLISDIDLSRKDTSHIFQMRTGHIPLNRYLE